MVRKRLKKKYSKYRYCTVKKCKNTSISTPGKLWIRFPNELQRRNTWLRLAQRDPSTLSKTSTLYLCEDHFDLPNDMANYMRYHIMGSVSHIRMKPGCVPRKFVCQSETNKRSRKTKKNNDWVTRDGNERTEDLHGIATDESETPTNIIHDPIPFIQSPKDLLEITVPSVNRDAVGVIIKEEAIDIHEETVEERATDVRVKIERIEDSDSDDIPDTSRTQVSEGRKISAKKKKSDMNINAERIPQTIYDPTPKETLEIIVPNMNPEGPVGTIKEEPIDMYEEAGETRHTTDIFVKIEEYGD